MGALAPWRRKRGTSWIERSLSMAEQGPGSTNRTAKKRLARAKIKPTEHGIKSSKGRNNEAANEPSKAEQQKARKQKIIAICVGIFAVIMALSMMLPSLTYIFGNNADQQAQQEQTQEQATSEETKDDAADQEEAKTPGMDTVDANYAAVVNPLEAKLKDNPKDLATLLSLGNNYMNWGSAATSYATDETSEQHVLDLFNQAIGYYDRYLELNDSAVVKANRAMCVLNTGDTEGALAALQQVTVDNPDYGPAWANIGMIYEYQQNTEKAKEAYQKAIEVDKNDEYGAQSYANRRLAAMAASEGEGLTDETAESANTTESTGAEALEDALGGNL